MKKTLRILAALLCCNFALKAQELMPLNTNSPVGNLGTIGGREAIVVDLGGSIGKLAVATKNIGVNDVNPYGTEFNLEDAFDASVTGLTDGWFVPSAAELEALKNHLQPNQAMTGLEWNVTQTSVLQFPGYRVDDQEQGYPYQGIYASSDRRQENGYWYYTELLFFLTAYNPPYIIIDEIRDPLSFHCVIRPFHLLPAPGNNEIWYTSANHEVVMPYASDAFGATIQSNVYDAELNVGVIIFNDAVTSIGDYAFYSCTGLTSITIPSSVTSIGQHAFDYCTGLTSTTIPDNVTFIDGHAFSNCSNLTSITIPGSVTSIGENAFSGCIGLTSIDLPSSLLSLGGNSFYGCSGLTSITIPSSVTSIGNGILSLCSSLQSVVVESGNAVYDSRENCNAIVETATNTIIAGFTISTFPSSVNAIGEYAFSDCLGLTSITIPSSVTTLGNGAFFGCKDLASITIPGSIESIGMKAFADCTSLASITIPNGSIGSYAFSGCSGLESVIMQDGMTSIGEYAFYDCSGLTFLAVSRTYPPALAYRVFNDVSRDIPVYVPNVEAYRPSAWGEYFTNICAYSMVVYKQIALNEINICLHGAELSPEDAAAVQSYIQIINGVADDAEVNETNIAIVEDAKNAALAIINYQNYREEKDEALAAIEEALQGETCESLISLVQQQIDIINGAYSLSAIINARDAALEKLAIAVRFYKLGRAEGLGEMGMPCEDCPAVEVSDDNTTIILYNPKNMTFKKAEWNK